MATVASNLVTPQQAALDAKTAFKSPLAPLSSTNKSLLSSAFPAAGTSLNPLAPKTAAPTATPPAQGAIKKQTVTEYHAPETAKTDPQIATNGSQNSTQSPLLPNAFQGAVGGLVSASNSNQALKDKASQIGDKYAKEQADLGIFDRAAAGDLSTGSVAVGGGNAQLEYNAKSGRSAALTNAENAELAPINQELTATAQQQSGLGTAASQTQPSGSFPFVFDPATGTFKSSTGASTGTSGAPTLSYNPQQDASTLAAAVVANKLPYSDAVSAMGYAGNVGTAALQTAILAAGGDITALQAASAAKQSNIGTSSTTATNTASAGYQKSYQDYQELNKTYNGAQSLGNLLIGTMQKGGINSNGSIDYNLAANTLKAHLSDPDYAQFVSTLINTRNVYQSILTSNGATAPTTADANLLKILNENSSMNAIISSLNQLNNEVYMGRLIPQAQQVNDYLKQLQ